MGTHGRGRANRIWQERSHRGRSGVVKLSPFKPLNLSLLPAASPSTWPKSCEEKCSSAMLIRPWACRRRQDALTAARTTESEARRGLSTTNRMFLHSQTLLDPPSHFMSQLASSVAAGSSGAAALMSLQGDMSGSETLWLSRCKMLQHPALVSETKVTGNQALVTNL